MRAEPSSAAWRLTALLLGASWVVTLAVACGGGGDDVIAMSVATGATGAVGSGARAEALGLAVAAAAPQTLAQTQGQAPGPGAAAMPATQLQPCSDDSRRPAQLAAVPAHLRAPVARGDELGDEALNSPGGRPRPEAAGAAPPAEAPEAK